MRSHYNLAYTAFTILNYIKNNNFVNNLPNKYFFPAYIQTLIYINFMLHFLPRDLINMLKLSNQKDTSNRYDHTGWLCVKHGGIHVIFSINSMRYLRQIFTSSSNNIITMW